MNDSDIKSFARRIGKSLSNLQKNLLKDELPKYQIDVDNPLSGSSKYKGVVIEIGIGMGEHFVNQAHLNPDLYFMGIEPYLNGIANCLKLSKDLSISNFGLWPDCADLLLPHIPKASIDKIYLLFPDPWLKTKQKKRRFASVSRLTRLKDLLKDSNASSAGGEFIFVSDIKEYFDEAGKNAAKAGMILQNIDDATPHEGYITTKFHQKAIDQGRRAYYSKFLVARS